MMIDEREEGKGMGGLGMEGVIEEMGGLGGGKGMVVGYGGDNEGGESLYGSVGFID